MNELYMFFIVLTLAIINLVISQAIAAPSYIVFRLTDNSYSDDDPQIKESGFIIWSGGEVNSSNIFLYDGITINKISNDNYKNYNPQINNNGRVVW